MGFREQVISGLGWTATAKFLSQLITWGLTILIMRILNPSDYGLMAFAMTFIFLVTLLSEFGFGAAIIQKPELDRDLLSGVFGMMLAASVLCTVAAYACAPLIGAFFGDPKIVGIVRALSLQFLALPFSTIPKSLLSREMRLKEISIVDFASAVFGGVITFLLAIGGMGVWSLVWGSMSIILLRTIMLILYKPMWVPPSFSLHRLAQVASFGGYITSGRLLYFVLLQADILIVGKLLGKESLGFYSVGNELATLTMSKVNAVIQQVAFPAFSAIQVDREKIRLNLLRATWWVGLAAFPVLWGISSVSREIVLFFLGGKWLASALPLQLLALTVPFRMILGVADTAVIAVGKPRIATKIHAFSALSVSVFTLIGCFWGLEGVCVALLSLAPLNFAYGLSRVAPALGVRPGEILGAISRPMLAGSIMYVAVALTGYPLAGASLPLTLALRVLTGAVVYAVVMALLDRQGYRQALSLLRVRAPHRSGR